jgi:hypothetical protein
MSEVIFKIYEDYNNVINDIALERKNHENCDYYKLMFAKMEELLIDMMNVEMEKNGFAKRNKIEVKNKLKYAISFGISEDVKTDIVKIFNKKLDKINMLRQMDFNYKRIEFENFIDDVNRDINKNSVCIIT